MLPYNNPLSLLVPQDVMHAYAKRVRALRSEKEVFRYTDEDFIEEMFSEVGMEQDHDGFHVV